MSVMQEANEASGMDEVEKKDGFCKGNERASFFKKRTKTESHDFVSERIVDYLYQLYPIRTAFYVEHESGINRKMVGRWLKQLSRPSASDMLSLITTYGAEFLEDIMNSPPDWVVFAAHVQKRRQKPRPHRQLIKNIASFTWKNKASSP